LPGHEEWLYSNCYAIPILRYGFCIMLWMDALLQVVATLSGC